MKTHHTKAISRLAVLLAASAALTTLATTSGCFAVAVGAGTGATVAYRRGDLETTLDASFDQSLRAIDLAIAKLKFVKVSEKKDVLQADVIARNAADKKIELQLVKLTDHATKLKIRVGVFGDEGLQAEILDQVKAGL